MTLAAMTTEGQSVFRINQVGYLPDDHKVAVFMSDRGCDDIDFSISDGHIRPDSVIRSGKWGEMNTARVYFSSITKPGKYRLVATDRQSGDMIDSTTVYIGKDAYSRISLNELPLNYMRQQRCGYNPVHGTTCHQHDGYLVLSGENDGTHYDVSGGWHDASDYLQYLTTSANAVYQLMFAYRMTPEVWKDLYDSSGRREPNGIPDILDEARWGLEWMCRMNPKEDLYFNQIADDRDHRFVGKPQNDTVNYGYGAGTGRPIYPVSSEPYGLKKYKNRSTGEASSLGKFASAFALGAEVFADIDPEFAAEIGRRALPAYLRGKKYPGVSQTAPCSSPYFYEEDNWVDDMELAATMLKRNNDAVKYGRVEPVSPWMGADSARHYQWYPFVNLGHYELAKSDNKKISSEFRDNMRKGLRQVAERGNRNPFRFGVPFVWCSNNLTVGFITQAMLYRELTSDNSFMEAETSARDWLFGLNPWGQTMIIMPEGTVQSSPCDPHSAMTDITVAGQPGRNGITGGLVDGPVYDTIFNSLWGVHLRNNDRFAPYQGRAVYHDDFSDYSSNEPTMDGTASLTFMLGRLCR